MAQSTTLTHDLAEPSPLRTITPAGHRRKVVLRWVALHITAITAALFFVLPFVFVFLTAMMTDQQTLTRELWPNPWHFGNISTVWNTPGFLTWWRNTIFYATFGTVLTVASSAAAVASSGARIPNV